MFSQKTSLVVLLLAILRGVVLVLILCGASALPTTRHFFVICPVYCLIVMFGGPVWHCDHLIGEAGCIAFCWFVTCFIVCLLLLLVSLVGKLVCDTCTDYHSLFALPLGIISRLTGL